MLDTLDVGLSHLETISEMIAVKEDLARIETDMIRGMSLRELIDAGYSRATATRLERRASFPWADGVSFEQQDTILSVLINLRLPEYWDELYRQAVAVCADSSLAALRDYTKKLVAELHAAHGIVAEVNKRFSLGRPDETGGCYISGYLPAHTAALLASQLDQAFRKVSGEGQSIGQRSADAFLEVIKDASSAFQARTGHCSLVAAVTEEDEMCWEAKLATNVGIDLSLYDIDMLSGDRVTDYIVVKDHRGAVKSLVTAERSANFAIRVALFARDRVCQHPGCHCPASRCDAHHVWPWARGGPTSVDNLTLLCRFHHRWVDDTWFRRHVEMVGGLPWWVSDDGKYSRNTAPTAPPRPGSR